MRRELILSKFQLRGPTYFSSCSRGLSTGKTQGPCSGTQIRFQSPYTCPQNLSKPDQKTHHPFQHLTV